MMDAQWTGPGMKSHGVHPRLMEMELMLKIAAAVITIVVRNAQLEQVNAFLCYSSYHFVLQCDIILSLVTLAYSDSFGCSQECHCNRGALYYNLTTNLEHSLATSLPFFGEVIYGSRLLLLLTDEGRAPFVAGSNSCLSLRVARPICFFGKSPPPIYLPILHPRSSSVCQGEKKKEVRVSCNTISRTNSERRSLSTLVKRLRESRL